MKNMGTIFSFSNVEILKIQCELGSIPSDREGWEDRVQDEVG